MTQANVELLAALEDAGAAPEKARAAAAAVAPAAVVQGLATKADLAATAADLRVEIQASEARQTWRLFAATGLVLTALGIAVGILLAFG